MSKFAQGVYKVTNTAKYVGKREPRYRSGWEHAFMRFCDSNENILQWASEAISIPYRHPVTGKNTIYIPDFLITYRTKDNQMKAEVIEIKPKKQSVLESKASARDRTIVAINYAKWASAQAWCKQKGLVFRVLTEEDLFHNGKR